MSTAATYIGISNENEFYSHHYLSEVFKGDIKQVLDGWQQRKADESDHEGGFETPHQRLKGLARDYFIIRERMRRGSSHKERISMQRQFFSQLLPVFGFAWHPHQITMDDGFEVPVLAAAGAHEHSPDLLILGAFDISGDDLDPLATHPHQEQFHGSLPVDKAWLADDWNHLITNRIYGQPHPPRWVLLLSDAQLLLIDRLKWNQNRLLRFDWDEILGRKDDATLKATAVLLHKESLLPDEGTSLLDTLDENAHKQAFSVSEDLKYTLREAIELLGNEASAYLIQKAKEQKLGIYTGGRALDAEVLSLECLRYMYRLLFLFYIEARPDLAYVPLASDAYRKGYSLESLRDLEMVRLTTEESRSGTFIHQSIKRLFSLIYEGYQGVEDKLLDLGFEGKIHNSFAIDRLDSHLFDPKGTPNLNKVVFRNDTLQRVIELMSLTRPGGRGKRRGRISYAQLGINQLGAVYEALLSYRGFFADRDLYEVKKKGTHPDELETGYFVPAEDLDLYEEEERVFDKDEHGHQKLRRYDKGTFIYRLAGRDRQKSASYYTPEVLTKTLVKYALKELLKEPGDEDAKTADEILKLTICEPAMGSAAFLNEAVNQLAEAYLERKQIELGQRIPHDEYTAILQRVKMCIADRNTFGVDLNPVAVELAEISLWLNAIHGGKQMPWFGYQLFNGNSLIGARRQVYDISLLRKRVRGDAWYDHAPQRLDPFTMAMAPVSRHSCTSSPDAPTAGFPTKELGNDENDSLTSSCHSREPFRHSREGGNPSPTSDTPTAGFPIKKFGNDGLETPSSQNSSTAGSPIKAFGNDGLETQSPQNTSTAGFPTKELGNDGLETQSPQNSSIAGFPIKEIGNDGLETLSFPNGCVGNPCVRKESQVYHFLLPDPGMAAYKDTVAKSLEPERFAAIKKWRTEFCKPFTPDEIDTLQFLSAKVDELWAEHAKQLKDHRDKTEDDIPVWPQADDATGRRTTTTEKDVVRATGIFNLNAKTASAYRRLKMAMDYWCSLWFWPIDQSDQLPSRDEFLMEMMLLLSGDVLDVQPKQTDLFAARTSGFPTQAFGDDESVSLTSSRHSREGGNPEKVSIQKQGELIPPTQAELGLTIEQPSTQPDVKDSKGQLRIEKLFEHFPRLRLVHELSERHRFFHWELTFADVFAEHGGFDLILGNPPWLKVEWQEAGVLGDFHPLFNLRKFSATKLRDEREAAFAKYLELKNTWFTEYEQADATQAFLNATQNYPLLKGVQTNLYKCFLPQAWMLGSKQAVSGFLHPEGVYDDPKGGKFRAAIYPRLKAHFQITNVKLLFAEVMIWVKYSINIYGSKSGNVRFDSISNIFDPLTIDRCYAAHDEGDVPGIKNDEGQWNTAGHAHRIIEVTETELATFATLYDEAATPAMQARLPALHARELITVLEKFASQPKRLGDLQGEYYSLEMWHETNAQNDGTIRRHTCFPESPEQWILSGPHFFVGNPCYKTPRRICNTPRAYDALDLTVLPDDYLPRTNYIPACVEAEYRARTPRVPWIDEGETAPKRVTEYYRFNHRRQLSQSGERTFISAIFPKGAASLNTCVSTVFKSNGDLVNFGALTSSLVFDFYLKSTGKGDLYSQGLASFPVVDVPQMLPRYLCLNAINVCYADLWQDCWQDKFTTDHWTKSDQRLPDSFFANLGKDWHRDCALRTDYARRQALVEIDVLASLALGLTLDELLTIYRVQFPVLQQNERGTWYDAKGRVIFSVNIGIAGVGLPRKAARNDTPCTLHHPNGTEESKIIGWEDVRDLPAGYEIIRTVMDDTLPGGPREKQITYAAPFDRCNREDDYRQAWAVFEERFNE